MKLCVTSTGESLDSKVDERFGRAYYFLIIDTDTMDFEAVQNTAQSEGLGAGIRAAQIITDKGIEALLTGFVGPKAFTALETANVKIYEGASGTESAKHAVERFKKGEYKEASAPSGGPRRGPGRGGGFRGGKWQKTY